MKNYLFGVATIFAMSVNIAISGVLPVCRVSATSNQIMEIRDMFLTIRSSIVSIYRNISTIGLIGIHVK